MKTRRRHHHHRQVAGLEARAYQVAAVMQSGTALPVRPWDWVRVPALGLVVVVLALVAAGSMLRSAQVRWVAVFRLP